METFNVHVEFFGDYLLLDISFSVNSDFYSRWLAFRNFTMEIILVRTLVYYNLSLIKKHIKLEICLQKLWYFYDIMIVMNPHLLNSRKILSFELCVNIIIYN